MEGEGFEPSKAEPADLQSDPFDRSGTPPKKNLALNFALGSCLCQQIHSLFVKFSSIPMYYVFHLRTEMINLSLVLAPGIELGTY